MSLSRLMKEWMSDPLSRIIQSFHHAVLDGFLGRICQDMATLSRTRSVQERGQTGNCLIGFEQFEPRICLSPLSHHNTVAADLQVIDLVVPQTAEQGSRISVSATWQETGPIPKGAFRLELRLSRDTTIDQQDLLLAAKSFKRSRENQVREWVAQVDLPQTLQGAEYHLAIVLDTFNHVKEKHEANNSAVTAVDIFRSRLPGSVHILGSTQRQVALTHWDQQATPIDPTVDTWIVIHGRNQSPLSSTIHTLAEELQKKLPSDQVLVLDWGAAADSGSLGGSGESFIKPTAAWLAKSLSNYGFDPSRVNLVGYSWGAYIGSEMAERWGPVNSLLTIDAARDFPGGTYNPEKPGEVSFHQLAKHSWAVFSNQAPLVFGSAITSPTADEAFLLSQADHFAIVPLTTQLITSDPIDPIGSHFQIERLKAGLLELLWVGKRWDESGTLQDAGDFDVVLEADLTNLKIAALVYFDGEELKTIAK